jgi:hypothetical protein
LNIMKRIPPPKPKGNVIYLHRAVPNPSRETTNVWDELTVARLRQQHADGELNPAILEYMMSAIGLPA